MFIEYTPSDAKRFYEKVSKTPTERGCLEWTAFHNAAGYGAFWICGGPVGAHRIAWELVNGPIPEGLLIRHLCNNPLCCNPAHLEPGTYAENTQDMIDSGRFRNAPNTTVPYARPYVPTVIERFYAKISKIPTENGCLDWTGHLSRGYGRFSIGDEFFQSHRFAWELVNGPIPEGMFVCHHCDRRSCCRVDHLFLGTQADNMRDREAKGRGADHSGEKHGRAKLTEAQVIEIRSPRFAGWSQPAIAEHFGVSRGTIGFILLRKNWTHLDNSGDLPVPNAAERGCNAKGETHPNAKLTETQILEMRSEKFAGWSQSAISEHFGVSRGQVGRILNRERWAHLNGDEDAPVQYRPIAGETIGTSKLTEAAVLEIRSGEKFSGWTRNEIAEHFGVSRSAIMGVLSRKTWKHI